MRVVLDTVVFVKALIKPFNACGRSIFTHGRKFQLVVSKDIVEEILEVLRRQEITSKFSPVVEIDFPKVLDFISQAVSVEADDIGNISRDIKDDKFLATAVSGDADYLVSEDKDLLILGQFKGVKIITCMEFADIIESLGS